MYYTTGVNAQLDERSIEQKMKETHLTNSYNKPIVGFLNHIERLLLDMELTTGTAVSEKDKEKFLPDALLEHSIKYEAITEWDRLIDMMKTQGQEGYGPLFIFLSQRAIKVDNDAQSRQQTIKREVKSTYTLLNPVGSIKRRTIKQRRQSCLKTVESPKRNGMP